MRFADMLSLQFPRNAETDIELRKDRIRSWFPIFVQYSLLSSRDQSQSLRSHSKIEKKSCSGFNTIFVNGTELRTSAKIYYKSTLLCTYISVVTLSGGINVPVLPRAQMNEFSTSTIITNKQMLRKAATQVSHQPCHKAALSNPKGHNLLFRCLRWHTF